MSKNYKVTAFGFGSYPKNSVLPEWAVARAASVDQLVKRGIVIETTEAVNVDLRIPTAKAQTDTSPSLVEESNRLRIENERLAADNQAVTGQLAALRGQITARDKSLGEQTAEISRLRAENERLQLELRAASELIGA